MSKPIKLFLILFLTGAAFFLLYQPGKIESSSSPKATAHTSGLTIEGTSVQGASFSLAEHTGKIVIIDFWATWCPPCVKEIPHFIALQKAYPDHVQVIGISVDDSAKPVQPFITKHAINYPILMVTPEISAQFPEITGIPTTFTLDKDGNIIDKAIGYRDLSYFKGLIDGLLNP